MKVLMGLLLVTGFCLGQKKQYDLVWEENFDGNQLDPKIWNFELGDGCPNLCGWGNNEAQLYTDTNHKLENGFLTITTKKEGNVYSSTRITTKDKKEFQYGKIEARAKLPIGSGLWPAFWMLGANISEVGWPQCGEIDILEYVGKEPDIIFTSLHTQASHGNTINTKKTKINKIIKIFFLPFFFIIYNFWQFRLLVGSFVPLFINRNLLFINRKPTSKKQFPIRFVTFS